MGPLTPKPGRSLGTTQAMLPLPHVPASSSCPSSPRFPSLAKVCPRVSRSHFPEELWVAVRALGGSAKGDKPSGSGRLQDTAPWGQQAHAQAHRSRGRPIPSLAAPNLSPQHRLAQQKPGPAPGAGGPGRQRSHKPPPSAKPAQLSRCSRSKAGTTGEKSRTGADGAPPAGESRPHACLSVWGQGAPALPGTQDQGGATQSSPVLSMTPFLCRK